MAKCEMCGSGLTFDSVRYYVPDENGQRHYVCESCNRKGVEAVKNGKVFKYDTASQKIILVDKIDSEIRKKCNVCNHVFCYTDIDIAMNKEKLKFARISALAALGATIGGNSTTGAVYNSNAQNTLNGVVNYNKCPQCGSIDLRTLSKEEYQLEMKNGLSLSPVDELKKYKELFDEGIITQEEFTAKKKQLLGL